MKLFKLPKSALAARLAGLLALVLLVLGITTVILVSRRHSQVMNDGFTANGQAIALSLASSSVETLLFHDASAVQSFVDSYRSLPGVAYIYLVSGGGEVLVHTFMPAMPAGLLGKNSVPQGKSSSVMQIEVSGYGDIMDIAAPILYGVVGEVHVGMNLKIIDTAVRSMVLNVIWQFGLALILGVAVVYVVVRGILRPVAMLATASVHIGEGDLRVTVPEDRRDEIGDLARAFNAMVRRLRETVTGINESRRDLEEAAKRLQNMAAEMLNSVASEQKNVGETENKMNEMKVLSEEISGNLVLLGESTRRTDENAGSIYRAATSIAEATRNLFNTVESTSSTLSELDAAIKEVTVNVDSLKKVAEGTATSVESMGVSIRSVEGKTAEVSTITGQVEQQFRTGIEAVNKTVDGMQNIKQSSTRVSSLLKNLNTNMRTIEEILKLIVDINDQIGLLALNAAIIAAQSGGRGHGFSVVADEMKALSERTQKSIEEISQMIGSIQNEAKETLKAMSHADSLVDQSLTLSQQAGETIHAVQESVEEVNSRLSDIAGATREQSQAGERMTTASRDLTFAIERLAGAAVEQAMSSGGLLRGAEEMRRVAEQVDSSVNQQAQETGSIHERIKEINQVTGKVERATEKQLAALASVVHAIVVMHGISDRNSGLASQLGDVIRGLNERAEVLKNETVKFILP